ncbi:hypothetical protein HYT58_02705 [Candidatus Woesearchaeota archaeon]|nr:hypothetical protein [Candidatus Woesearchaeota archaeon]
MEAIKGALSCILILIIGIKRDATAVELKSAILEILGYPQDLLTKSKSLIYRYTVYTPQEGMKHILMSSRDDRLETIRRVFGIDKYKRINENFGKFLSKVKDKVKEYEIRLEDLPKIVEKEVRILDELNRDIRVNRTLLDSKLEQIENNKENVVRVKESLERLKTEIGILQENKFDADRYKNIEESIKKNEMDLYKINNDIQDLKTKKAGSEENKKKFIELDFCPYCNQKVSGEHKHDVVGEETNRIEAYDKKIVRLIEEKSKIESVSAGLKEEIKRMQEIKVNYEIFIVKRENIDSKNMELERLDANNDKLTKEIEVIKVENSKLENKWQNLENIQDNYDKFKEELEELRENSKTVEIEILGIERESRGYEYELNELRKRTEILLKIKENLSYIRQLRYWIENSFMNIMLIMEKKILLRVHNEFNSLFEKWFNMLVDSEILKVKLDEEFTPLIEQAGHDMEYENLSGGEKTAAALAYRLALNQVINKLMSTIHTKDIIVLDEPTDGFSEEQLDRLRLVLDELDLNQVILVSHENKIESFVDHVIRFNKEGHETRVIY